MGGGCFGELTCVTLPHDIPGGPEAAHTRAHRLWGNALRTLWRNVRTDGSFTRWRVHSSTARLRMGAFLGVDILRSNERTASQRTRDDPRTPYGESTADQKYHPATVSPRGERYWLADRSARVILSGGAGMGVRV